MIKYIKTCKYNQYSVCNCQQPSSFVNTTCNSGKPSLREILKGDVAVSTTADRFYIF